MKNISLEINCENAAFHESCPEDEVARILRRIADQLVNGTEPYNILDINGNPVGKVSIED